jgi:aspartyl-tRNA(Asn)/glutamyl-tRNA(Gln) amidotransferase subunit A
VVRVSRALAQLGVLGVSGLLVAVPRPAIGQTGSSLASQTPLQRLERNIDVLQHQETSINAFIDVDLPAARARALSQADVGTDLPLWGKVIAIKDNVHVAGFRTTAGTNELAGMPLASNRPADAPIVTALRGAGAVIIGTTNMDTWARGVRGLSEVDGQTKNPLDRTRNAGGSSAGSAAAVAAGMADGAIGTDTCGSIRYPASSVGIYGLKPTWGAVSAQGVVPLAPGQDVVGPLASDPATLAALWNVLSGSNTTVPNLREPEGSSANNVLPKIGVLRGGGDISARWRSKASTAGFTFVDAGTRPSTVGVNLIEVQFPIAKRQYVEWRSGRGESAWLTPNGVIGSGAAARDQERIMQRRAALRAELVKRMDDLGVDVLAQPVNIALPARLGERQPSGNCMLASGSGLPAIALPGVPAPGARLSIGVELIGRPGEENLLLDLAALVHRTK